MCMQRFGAAALAAALSLGSAGAAGDAKAVEVLASTRKAIGNKAEALTSLAIQAAVQRNVGNFQMTSDVELLVELPDKYLRSETATGPMASLANTTGFNGDRPLKTAVPAGMPPGGGMVIRMGPGAAALGAGEKPTANQQQQLDRQMVRGSRHEIGRLMLGWFGMAHPTLNARYTYAGEAESPDGRALVIDVTNDDGFAARLFVDEKTRLPLMVTYQGPPPRIITAGGPRVPREGPAPAATPMTDQERKKVAANAETPPREMEQPPPAPIEFTLYFEDWREEDGLQFPHALRRAQAGTITEQWTVTKVRVNPRIDSKKFETN